MINKIGMRLARKIFTHCVSGVLLPFLWGAWAALGAGAQVASAQQLPLPDRPRFAFQGLPEGLGLATATVTCLAQD